mgnify:CR=1 FL=1
MQGAEPCQVRLAGQDDRPGAHVAAPGAQAGPRPRPAGPDPGHLGLFVDPAAQALHHARQPARQPRRLQVGVLRAVPGAERSLHPDPAAGLRGAQQALAVAEPEALEHAGVLAHHSGLVGEARHEQRADHGEPRVDALGGADPADLVHRVVQRALQRPRPVAPVHLRDRIEADVQLARAPAAVSARGAESGDPPLDDRDAQRRIVPEKVVGGPQPGVPRPENRHVHVDRPVQRQPRRQIVPTSLQPEGVPGIRRCRGWCNRGLVHTLPTIAHPVWQPLRRGAGPRRRFDRRGA